MPSDVEHRRTLLDAARVEVGAGLAAAVFLTLRSIVAAIFPALFLPCALFAER